MDGVSGLVSGLKTENSLQSSKTRMNRKESAHDNQKYNRELKKATGQFEEFFLHQMMKEMRKSVPKDGLIAKKQGEEIFNDMLDQRYSELLAKRGGMGVGNFLFEQLKKK